MSVLNASSRENLEALSKAIYEKNYPGVESAPVYASFDAAFAEITRMAKEERIVFVIDEYPYLAKADKSISSRLQHIIDHIWKDSQLFLILCGSSMSFMEYQVLGYESPLYGRRTGQFRIQALDYKEMSAFNSQLDEEQQSLVYGITGGASRSNEISTKVGIESAVCAKYLKVLLDLGIIKKETPITEKGSKKTIYAIGDNFFRFWYRFVPQNTSAISAGRIERIYDKLIKQHFSDYMGLVFEQMCREYLLRYAEDLPIILSDVGQWWGTDAKAKKEVQIDIVGTPIEGKVYIIGSCKYRNEAIGVDELELLKYYATVFGKGKKYYYYIFSKSGFTQGLQELAAKGEVKLLTLKELYK